ncbi:cell division FtsA domain-containing protein [Haloplasma contractile]|nr:cell division FtsA domain-containing protein [Haloplasma contractile]
MKRNIYASLDLGANTIKLLVSEFVGERQNILFVDEIKSTGIEHGFIRDKAKVIADLQKLKGKCESFLNIKLNSIVLSLPSIELDTKTISNTVTVNHGRVKGSDIKKMFNEIYEQEIEQVSSEKRKKEVSAIIPINFSIGKNKKYVFFPLNEICREITMNANLLTLDKQVIISHITTVEEAGLHVIDIMPNVATYLYTLLSPEEMTEMSCVVDIGKTATTITILEKGVIIFSEQFSIGGNIITQAIKDELQLDFEDAEEFKLTHGVCGVGNASDEVIYEKDYGDHAPTYITEKDIAEIVEANYMEIMRIVKQYLFEVGVKTKVERFIFIGGATEVRGFLHLIKQTFGEHSTVRRPSMLGVRHPKYSSAISMHNSIYFFDSLFEENYEMVTFNKEQSQEIDEEEDEKEFI